MTSGKRKSLTGSRPAVVSWQLAGASVPGDSHLRTGTPNQDAYGWRPRCGQGESVAFAVADGHGGAEYLRSDLGARYAVRTVLSVLAHEFMPQLVTLSQNAEPDLTRIKRLSEDWLPRLITRRWSRSVLRHLRRYPLDLPGAYGHPERSEEEIGLRCYGATLVATLITPWFQLYLQLGDGDILLVDTDGAVSRPPLPHDPALLGNETTSLCSPDPWRLMRTHFQPTYEIPPALVLLATDGYANSFADEAAFHQVGADLFDGVEKNGLEATEQALPAWLSETSALGSGDDITLVIGRALFESGTIE